MFLCINYCNWPSLWLNYYYKEFVIFIGVIRVLSMLISLIKRQKGFLWWNWRTDPRRGSQTRELDLKPRATRKLQHVPCVHLVSSFFSHSICVPPGLYCASNLRLAQLMCGLFSLDPSRFGPTRVSQLTLTWIWPGSPNQCVWWYGLIEAQWLGFGPIQRVYGPIQCFFCDFTVSLKCSRAVYVLHQIIIVPI